METKREKQLRELFETHGLKEHSVYKVKVKASKDNVEHSAILFTGFKSGAYCEVYTNSYDVPILLEHIHSIRAFKFLTKFK